MKQALFFLLLFLTAHLHTSQFLHQEIKRQESKGTDESDTIYIWEKMQLLPFDELIISWDAARPEEGHYLIRASLFTTEWSSWLDYAVWGASDQYTFDQQLPNGLCRTYQDAVEVLEGGKATGFRISIQAKEGASLQKMRTLHACVTDLKAQKMTFDLGQYSSILLNVGGLSQMAIPDGRNRRWCSPASTTCVINYLSPSLRLSPLSFAEEVRDSAFDIYGNWIFNTAQASHLLGDPWHCHVVRLTSFDQIVHNLQNGYPVVVSIKGPLQGSAMPYESGHLVVIRGYNAEERKVLCMDPAFPINELTLVSYPLKDFLAAWNRRHGVAYLFYRSSAACMG
jgi:hypothetical protein